ncbi:zinc finger protein 92-like [Anthonomus grandis grandis]|uniref:zinc finger protein 92-like n=1 Tax=Anthonomus grandis grandis TaxID=2921223 RepID=UPI0021656EF7|nr:zinc finger protein 92-like [Anthonomus grandis grandis]
MDVEDENNSYLKYLNDTETPSAYLVENNEVGLFSVEPIFTEMEASDWPQEGFPLLLTSSLITEECTPASDIPNNLSDVLPSEPSYENIANHEEDSNTHYEETIETLHQKSVIDSSENNLMQVKNQLIFSNDTVQATEISFDQSDEDKNEIAVDQNCLQIMQHGIQQNGDDDNFIAVYGNDSNLDLETNENYILIESPKNLNNIIQVVKSDHNTPTNLQPTVNHLNKKPKVLVKNIRKSMNDLFSTVIANKCRICSFLCEDLEQIRKHINDRHPECMFNQNGLANGTSILLKNTNKNSIEIIEGNKEFTVYICKECHTVFIDNNELIKHMNQVHKTVSEEDCGNTDEKTKTECDQPILLKKQEKIMQKVKCSVKGCMARFPSDDHRRKHEKLHVNDLKSSFKCTECDKIFAMWPTTRVHMYKEHGMDFGMIVCPVCNLFKSYRTIQVVRHMMIHSEEKPFLCAQCGKTFKQLTQLKNHEVIHKVPEDLPTWTKLKKCPKCDKFLANSKILKSHIKTVHEGIKPFICNICGHKSSRKEMLTLHIRQHTATKPFECDYCTFRTGDPNSLRKHSMKHMKAASYQCPYCPYNCIQTGSLKNHFERKHKDQPGVFYCKHCSFSTINETLIPSHEKLHEVDKGQTCDQADSLPVNQFNDNDLQTDEETQSCFLNTESHIEETVDNGGITIPAGLEIPPLISSHNGIL